MKRTPQLLALLVACLLSADCQAWTWSSKDDSADKPLSRSSSPTLDLGKKIAKLPKPWPWNKKETGPRVGTPRRIVSAWTETILQQSGQPSMRGFGGRLFFYDDEKKPIAVEGQVVVYAFEETGRIATDHKPTRRYVFPPAEVARRQSESEVGVSYNFWLPWNEVGGPTADVSLIARFEPLQGGTLIVSESTRHRLPGDDLLTPTQDEMIAQPNTSPAGRSGVEQAAYSHQAPVTRGSTTIGPSAAAAGATPNRLKTSTITLPSRSRF
ncbi:hypothetical protein Mal64_05250 [Pseudobythopirellula maris]|uniref:Uncharacterized protein n=1 Tax=Pseudobythopirellula maris TaxID=2527991 RepID=A0A5C5ZTI0_9BACT|nr:hypothetical protein [Pseudobythopirellula maris]TWT90141.1 hypothetical protein Mal64_05250 [Pseudobythopirellula maris]